MMLVWALLVLPLVRVIVIHSLDSDDGYKKQQYEESGNIIW
jgi:hypothetical protein